MNAEDLGDLCVALFHASTHARESYSHGRIDTLEYFSICKDLGRAQQVIAQLLATR